MPKITYKKAARSFRSIAENITNDSFKKVFTLIADKEPDSYISDGVYNKELQHDMETVELIKDTLYGEVVANRSAAGESFTSVSEVTDSLTKWRESMCSNILTKDGFVNPLTGIGVPGLDPGTYSTAYTPVSMSPNQATSYYSSGGLPQIIVDKKAKGVLLNGYQFTCKYLSEDDRKQLKEYAESVNFGQAIERGISNGLVYGGALVYPTLKQDFTPTFALDMAELLAGKYITKNCIDYFSIVDRWNCIMVPDYDMTAKDYLSPDEYYIPISGKRVNSSRCGVIKPKQLPYWGALRQLGWGVSDYEGYITSLLAYKILIASIPIIAQQLSLLVHEIPLDGIIAQNGVAAADSFAQANSARMRNWSMINPVTVNSFGELKAINRTFSDFDKLLMGVRQDVAANSGIPESVLFHTLSTGFSDNTEEINLKQSETIKNVSNAVIPQVKPLVKLLVYSCFGPDSEQANYADMVSLSFDSPTVITNEERGKMLEKFSNAVNVFASAKIPVSDGIEIALRFIPDIELPDDLTTRLKSIEPEEEAPNPFEKGSEPNDLNTPKSDGQAHLVKGKKTFNDDKKMPIKDSEEFIDAEYNAALVEEDTAKRDVGNAVIGYIRRVFQRLGGS